MSKILVLDDRQYQELKRIFESTMQNSFMPQDMKMTEKRYSVVEWHRLTTVEEDGKKFWLDIPEIERCGKSKQVLVKDRHEVISAVNVDFEENQGDDGEWVSGVYPDGEDWFDYVAWAYLPE